MPDPMPEWAHPDVLGRMWTVGELAEALKRLGWDARIVDPNASYVHEEQVERIAEWPGDSDDEDGYTEVVFETVTEERVGQLLNRSNAWVSPDGSESFRLPRDPNRRATPFQAACVVALMADS
jgi:hypothetical protein